MKDSCEVICDLLPLYQDEICSDASKRMVEGHLAECDSCNALLQKMRDTTLDVCLQEEREGVVDRYAKKEKRRSLIVGICFASVIAVPVLISLIVNLVTGHALDWFFIVLTSLMVLASLTAVPLIAEKKRFLWAFGSFAASLTLLLLACALYTNGDWFFVASVSTLFGLSVAFSPIAIYQVPLKGAASKRKGLIVMSLDTLLFYGIIVTSGLHMGVSAEFWRGALLEATVNVAFAWILFGIIRYLRVDGFTKAGICMIISGMFLSLIHDLTVLVTEGVWHLTLSEANFGAWGVGQGSSGNIFLVFLLVGCGLGIIFLIVGRIRRIASAKR